MSTLKSDAVTAITSNTDLSLSGSGTGGVKVTDYLVQTKGDDIASATALTLGKDGNFFDVTGTTTITSIGTQGIGSHITLQFDGALTFTHDSADLILPGAANITTAAGDVAVMYEYASGDWRCVSYSKTTGKAVVPGGAWNIIGTSVASSSATLDQTGIDATYDTYAIGLSDIVPATDNAFPWFRLGDSSGVDSGGSDYGWAAWGGKGSGTWVTDSSDSEIELPGGSPNGPGNQATEGFGGMYYLHTPSDGTTGPLISGHSVLYDVDPQIGIQFGGGNRKASITVDRVQFLFSTGNVASGRMTVWGIAHA